MQKNLKPLDRVALFNLLHKGHFLHHTIDTYFTLEPLQTGYTGITDKKTQTRTQKLINNFNFSY